jgi:hypothetical protein
MRFKGTSVLFIVLVAIGAYVYFTEFRGREAREEEEASKSKVLQIDAKDITEISLIYPDRTITGVKKGENQWEITSPSGVEADSDAWELLTTGISDFKRDATVAENAQDLSVYGLNNPAVKVAAKLKDGKSVGFSFGGENPKKIGKYAKLENSNEVFLAALPWERTFTKTLYDMQNKKLLQFEVEDVDGVRIAEGAKELELQKSGDNWQLKKPLDVKAENAEVTTLISSIHSGRASSFPDPPVDAKAAGLEPPAVRITLHDGKANTDRVLLIGKTAEKDKYYARDAARDVVFTIDPEIPAKARRPVIAWRDKTVAAADWQKVDKVEIQRGSENLVLLKAGLDWKLPDGKKLQVDKVPQMLSTLEFEKARDIIDSPKTLSSYGLDKPKLQVVFWEGTKEVARAAFGADSKTPEGLYLKMAASPVVMVVSKDVFDRFNVKTEDLLDKSAESEPQK